MKYEKLLQTSPLTRKMISVSLLAMLGIFVYDWTAGPQLTYLHAADQYRTMLQSTGKKVVLVRKRLEIREKQLAELKESAGEIEGQFFSPKTSREFFSDIEPISMQSKCSIVALSLLPADPYMDSEEEESNSSVVKKQASIHLRGTYDHVMDFLKKLAGYSEKITISDLAMQKIQADSKELNVFMTVTVYMVEDKEIADNEM